MKKILVISIFIALNLSAQNLSDILESLNTSNKAKSILEKSKADIAQNEFAQTYASPEISARIAHADSIPSEGEDGLEYAIGFSQEITNPFSDSLNNTAVNEYTKSIKLETKHTLHILELDIASAYHNACISKEMSEKSSLLYEEQNKRYAQIEKAYTLGEISRKDLLFNKLDLSKLRQNVSVYKRLYLSEFSSLQESVDLELNELACNDLVLPQKHIELNPIEENSELKAIEYKKNAARAFYGVQDSAITSLGYELAYEEELDTRRYVFGISIPLGSLSSQKEKLKIEQLSLSTSREYEKAAMKQKIQIYSKLAVEKLEVLFNEYTFLREEVLPLNKDLVELSKEALLEGEGDIMEYLDSSRSYSLNVIEMLEMKKKYYYELFELYKIADIELGEQTCIK